MSADTRINNGKRVVQRGPLGRKIPVFDGTSFNNGIISYTVIGTGTVGAGRPGGDITKTFSGEQINDADLKTGPCRRLRFE